MRETLSHKVDTVTKKVSRIEHTLEGNGAIGLIKQVRITMYLVIAIAALMLVLVGERFLIFLK